jgi:bifunctional non-homologous end joining protein LigD
MLATLTNQRSSREGWLFEPKWDGERCLAFRRGRDLRLFSRNRKRLDKKYPEISVALQRQVRPSFIADGECQTACNIDPRSASNFDPPGGCPGSA